MSDTVIPSESLPRQGYLRRLTSKSLYVLLLASAALRVALVLRGGQSQFYWPDEGRILRTWVVLKLLMLKRPGDALNYILHIERYTPSHWFYTLLAIPFALV